MSRTPRDEAASALAVAEVQAAATPGRVLVLGDPRPDVAAAASRGGGVVTTWSRTGPEPWPRTEGGAALVALRLPRARRELEMLVHVAAGALAPGGRLLVYGANDEGVKSVPRHLAPFFVNPITLATGGHARLIAAMRSDDGPPPRTDPEEWLETTDLPLPWGRRPWVSVPGAFAHGRLDEGTALLLEHLPSIREGDRVLDYGAGTGILAAGALQACAATGATARVLALEPDRLAAGALARNVPDAHLVVAAGWPAVADSGPFDVVISNPPYHRGKDETLAEIESFLVGAARHLTCEGVLRCVVQRRLPLDGRAHGAGLTRVCVVADRGPYRIWEARR